jgi:hypothetical protein
MKGELKVNTRRGQGLVEHRVQGTAKKQRAGGAQVKSGKNFENISHSKHLIGIQIQIQMSIS